jgi:esterase/lipase superfamily enzyme
MRIEPKLNVDFFAHSMGNRLLVELATKLRNDQQALGRALVFAAPDIATDEFSQKILPDRFQTLYASEDDRALQVSTRFLHKSRRAGGYADAPGILIVSGVESIDTILKGHSYVFEDPRALRDIAKLINMQQKASTRGLTERRRGTDRYWVINP